MPPSLLNSRKGSRSAAAVSSILEGRKTAGPLDGFIHSDNWKDEEQLRRARLQIRFGVLSGIFAVAFAAFFFAIGHIWGGCIIGASGLITTQVPWVVRRTGNLTLTGYLYGFVLLLSFAGLCSVGGGVMGHAVAWLAAVPLVVLLLVDLRGALTWTAIAFATVLAMALCEMGGYGFPTKYDAQWASAVASMSAVGLVTFLAFLGLIFEQTRVEAFRRLNFVNQQIAAANDSLVSLNEEKSEFMNIAAHGLKNPLGIICGYADLLRMLEHPTSEQIRKQSGEILGSANRMIDIINNLLNVQAIEDGELELKSERINVAHLIRQVVAENATTAESKNIDLELLQLEDKLPAVVGDLEATHQIVENLVSNAVKYTPKGGTVRIRVGCSEDMVVVEVKDNGPGLSQEDQSKLFRKFTRLTPKPTGGEHASGLGLWIAKRAAEAMNGGVFCRSQLGEGASFGMRLPQCTDANATKVMPDEVRDSLSSVPMLASDDEAAKQFTPGEPLVGRLSEEEVKSGEGLASDGEDIALSN